MDLGAPEELCIRYGVGPFEGRGSLGDLSAHGKI